MVVKIRRDYMCRALGLFLTHKQCDVETGQMSSVETGQMSAVETGQMSAAETGQMSAVETGQMSSVARTDICLVSTHNVEVSEVSIVAMSQRSSLRKSVWP